MKIQTIETNGRLIYLFTSEGNYVTEGRIDFKTIHFNLNKVKHFGRSMGKEWQDRIKNALEQYVKKNKLKLVLEENDNE